MSSREVITRMADSVKMAESAPGIERAHTLPSQFYVDPAVYRRECERIFWRTWQCVGWREQVTNPGDFFTFDLCGEPLLITRDASGAVRGFYNVCRHRAGPVAESCGSRKVFRCGYHGWTYSLDGKLLNAPEMEGTCDFSHADFSLRPVQAAEWEGLVFVNLDPDAEPLVTALGELPAQAGKFKFSEMRFYKRHDYVMECNWKVYIDNFLEGYHLPSVHPSLNRELDYSQYVTSTFARHSMQSSPIRDPENEANVSRRYAQSRGDLAAEYYWFFPNWMLNCYPDNMSLNIVLPLGPERCVAIFAWFFPPEVLKTDAPENTFKFSDEIQLEDGHICEVVYRNLKSRSYSRGRYSVKQEQAVYHFHQLYQAAINL
jgi:phenylpropionate dioxygenase-like ring-hydroxylating dioxygenase large terminal subunit